MASLTKSRARKPLIESGPAYADSSGWKDGKPTFRITVREVSLKDGPADYTLELSVDETLAIMREWMSRISAHYTLAPKPRN